MRNKLLIFLFICIFMIAGCTNLSTKTTNYVTNEITNKITNEVSDIDLQYTLEDLEDTVQKLSQKVDQNTIGVTLKIVKTVEINDKKCTFEDKEKVATGLIYKRIENKEADQIVSYTYYVVTNCHCVTSDSFPNETHYAYAYIESLNTEYRTEILGKDSIVDLAVLKFDCPYYLECVEFGDSSKVKKGTFACAIGHSNGYDYYNSITFGVVSNTDRIIDFDQDNDNISDYCSVYIQFDAASNKGNSGGGLYTLDGKLIGITQLKFTTSEIDNMAFAIPSNTVKFAIENYLEDGKEIIRPRFGITCMSVRDMSSSTMVSLGLESFPEIYNGEAPYGVYITGVAAAGSLVNIVKSGDIILEINGEKIYNNSTITGRLNSLVDYQIGTELEIKYYSCNDQEVKTINVTLIAG